MAQKDRDSIRLL